MLNAVLSALLLYYIFFYLAKVGERENRQDKEEIPLEQSGSNFK